MRDLRWLETHVGSIDEGIELINRFQWELTVIEEGRQWFVRSGDQVILRTDSRDAVDTFLYGMALGYSILPESYIKQFEEDHKID